MLITVLIVIAVLLALILFTIAAANPDAFWNGVGWILLLGVIAGVLLGGYYGVRWLIAADLSAAWDVMELVSTVFLSIIMIAFVPLFLFGLIKLTIDEHRQIPLLLKKLLMFLIFITVWPAACAAAFFSVRWLVALTGIDRTFYNFSVMTGIFAMLPASFAMMWLGPRLSAWLKIRTGTIRQDPEGE